MKRLFAEPIRLIFLGTLALLIFTHHAFYYETPWHEDGDFALNALQIERAKHLNEFYGNYSRFHFNHPGPAFFYVYAAGEYVLHDWLQVVPAPHNAHAIAGTALQVLFFAFAIGVAAAWIRARWFIPLALAVGGLHFGFARNAFTSIWPPHVLLMPFLCFLVAGASVAAGRVRHLPLFVLAGCFLVHGHVAQPLMVGLLFIASYARCWRTSQGAPWQQHRLAHGIAAACIALFLVPLAVDLTLGRDGNLAQIIEFMRAKKDHRTLGESAAYVISFLGYEHNQEHLIPEGGPINWSFLRAHAAFYFAWAGIAAGVTWGMVRLRRRAAGDDRIRFLSALLGLVGVGLVAALLWGWTQTGPMFEFNAHFLYALTFAPLLVAAALLAGALPERGALPAGAVLCGLGGLALWQTSERPVSANSAGYEWIAATAAALRADPQPNATKFLVFNHDDWGDVGRTALALKRLGQSYRTDESWRFMFGRYRTIDAEDLDALDKYSIWRFSRQPLPGHSALLGRNLRVYFEPAPLDPNGTEIACRRGGNLHEYSLFGLTTPDDDFSWSSLPKAALRFRSTAAATRDVAIRITAEPFTPPGLPHQPMHLAVNGRKVATLDLTTRTTVTARIPADVWNRRPIVTIIFEFPCAASPLELGHSADPRQLAWGISSIAFGPVTP